MIFRFTLSHEVLGEKEISEPDGWLDTKLTLERHADFASLVEYFNGEFIFYGNNGEEDGGIDFIREVETLYGVDAYLGITIDIAPDNYVFERVFSGQLDLSTINEMTDNKAQIAIIRDDFWAKFINRYDTQVNIQSDEDLDGGVAIVFDHINLRLTPQFIQKITDAKMLLTEDDTTERYSGVIPGQSGDHYGQLDWFDHEIAEVTDEYSLLIGVNSSVPTSKFIMEFPGTYRFEITVDAIRNMAFTPDHTSEYATLYIQFNEDSPIPFTVTDTDFINPGPLTDYSVSRYELDTTYVFDRPAGSVKIYFDIDDVSGAFNDVRLAYEGIYGPANWQGFDFKNRIRVTGNTSYPTTDSNSFLLHDVGGSICDRITSTQESFYSEYLGSENTKYRQYEENGCGWPYALTQGLQVRGYNLQERQYAISMKKWWEGINPHLNLSLMYDEVDGELVIRVEEKEHCFDSASTSIDIPYVREISRKYDPELLLKTVKVGSKKWEGEEASGIDTPQTKHTYALQLKRTGKDLVLESEFIAGDLTTETTRRQSRLKSADYKYDNDTFITAINPEKQTISPDLSPDIDDYIPELDENFSSVTNLLNAETRYNLRLTPGRQLLRWIQFLSASVYQYAGSMFKFTYGEGNYKMESTLDSDPCEPEPEELAENQDIEAVTPIYLPFEYEFTNIPLDWEDYRMIAENRKKAIGISQTDESFTKFFIKKLEYDIVQGIAKITAWPKTFMDILVIEGDFSLQNCGEPVVEGCFRITEDGELRITESTDYRILEEC
jgi:hypothetical protein